MRPRPLDPPPSAPAALVRIIKPTGYHLVPVLVPSGAALGGGSGFTGSPVLTGFICAAAEVENDNGARPLDVRAIIYDPMLVNPNPPLGVVTVFGTNDPINPKIWHFDHTKPGSPDVPGAFWGPNKASPAENVLQIWARYPPGNKWDGDQLEFWGVRATNTECDGGIIPEEFESTIAVPLNAPRHMRVDAKGFSGASVQAFNGNWTLSLSRGTHAAWDNGGDGKKTPRLELRLDLTQPMLWHMTLTYKRTAVVYVQSQNNWIWSRGNDLIFSGQDPAKKGVPLLLRVRPA